LLRHPSEATLRVASLACKAWAAASLPVASLQLLPCFAGSREAAVAKQLAGHKDALVMTYQKSIY